MRKNLSLLLLPLLFACGSEEPSSQVEASVNDVSPEDAIWEVPALTGSSALSIDGEKLDDFIVSEFLRDEWAKHYLATDDPSDLEKVTAAFYASPDAMFAPLVRDWLLLREHRERHPEPVDPHEFAHYKEGLLKQAGAAAQMLEDRIGTDQLNAHLERQFRIREILVDFQAANPGLAEGAVEAEYERRKEEMRASGEFTEEEIAAGPDLKTVHDAIEGNLLHALTEKVVDEWIAELLPVTVVEFTGPDGRTRVLDVPVRSPEAQDRQG